MFRLTREVRFAINPAPDGQGAGPPSNSHGGFPSMAGVGIYLAARITLAGGLEPRSQYLVNIKEIDDVVRGAVPAVAERIRRDPTASPARLVEILFAAAAERWGERFESVALALTPFLSLSAARAEQPMMRLSQRFEFSASHRLHNPALSDAENRATYGKCNNPLGHGHNYEVQVTLTGEPDGSGLLVDVAAFERAVARAAIDPLDHKFLNAEVEEFAELIPSVENIAKVIYRRLAGVLKSDRTRLASVTVWETPKTWCEYAE